jgi:hypothetical protein
MFMLRSRLGAVILKKFKDGSVRFFPCIVLIRQTARGGGRGGVTGGGGRGGVTLLFFFLEKSMVALRTARQGHFRCAGRVLCAHGLLSAGLLLPWINCHGWIKSHRWIPVNDTRLSF